MRKIALSVGGSRQIDEDMFKMLAEAGIDSIELSLWPEFYKDINYKELRSLSEKYQVELWSYHLPFTPFKEVEPSAIDSSVRKKTLEYFSELIKKATDIGFDKFVVHPSGEPIDPAERKDRLEYSKESLNNLAEIADTCGAQIAVENLPRTCIGKSWQEIKELISVNQKLRVCFDTNHLLEGDPIEFIEKIGNKLLTIHASDYDFIDERHWMPGEGKNDWIKIYNKLNEVGYDGPWLYEVPIKTPDTILRKAELTYFDFYNNAQEIFSGKEPTPIGTPII